MHKLVDREIHLDLSPWKNTPYLLAAFQMKASHEGWSDNEIDLVSNQIKFEEKEKQFEILTTYTIDDAVYRNFMLRDKGIVAFHAIGRNDQENMVVSDDVLELMENMIIHPLFGDYVDMTYDHIDCVAQDRDPLPHWAEIKGMISVTDHHCLRFIILHKIPVEKLIRHQLASCGLDENGKWVGFEKAKEIWLKE